MKKNSKKEKRQITKKMLEIESKDRLSAASIDEFSNDPKMLEQYLKSSIECSFSELLFRLTHEQYKEDKAHQFWEAIIKHRDVLNKIVGRDVGILVASLDYLTNIVDVISSPKITNDKSLEQTAESATRDDLTGLYLRGIFDFYLHREIVESLRYSRPLSLIMADIDDFKKVNDNYGHQKGDEVLKQIAKIFIKNSRQADLPARYGGEEISIILPTTPLEEACVLAERLRKEVFSFYESKEAITISIGLASFGNGITSSFELIKEADKALYSAKDQGKNRVVKSS